MPIRPEQRSYGFFVEESADIKPFASCFERTRVFSLLRIPFLAPRSPKREGALIESAPSEMGEASMAAYYNYRFRKDDSKQCVYVIIPRQGKCDIELPIADEVFQ